MIMKNELKSSSLTNAIFVCLMISILCGCLVFASHFKQFFQMKMNLQNELILRNASALNYFLANYDKMELNKMNSMDVIEDSMSSFGLKKSWGFYSTLTVASVFKKDTVLKTILVGQKPIDNDSKLALYSTNYDKALKFSGEININGNLEIPNGRIEEAYINGTVGNKIKIIGSQKKSKKTFPKLNVKLDYLESELESVLLEELNSNAYNSFANLTKVINVSNIRVLQDISISGNYIIKSSNEIMISSSSNLKDLLIIAPSIKVESGFIGSIQIQATRSVIIEEGVILEYPSSIYVTNNNPISVVIGSNSTILGGIVVDGVDYDNSLNTELVISEKSKIVGSVYCYGKTQLQGELIGEIYSDRFFLKTKSSIYENIIKDAVINRTILLNNFVQLPIFNSNSYTYEALKIL